MNYSNIIIAPVISEKSMQDATSGKYTFKVLKSANKEIIKKIIEEKFKINVIKISTAIIKGKRKRVGTRRTEVSTSSWKKAMVNLKSGQKIGLFEAGQTK